MGLFISVLQYPPENGIAKFRRLCFDSVVEEDRAESSQPDPPSVSGRGPLRHRPFRRNLLFGTTLLTLAIVFLGAVPFGPALMGNPFWFTVFWTGCFVLVGLVLLLAFYDLIRIRKDHRQRVRDLEKALAHAAIEARRIAREEAERS